MPPQRPPKPISPSRPLARRAAKNDPKYKIYVYTEGKLTEPDYLNNFYRDICVGRKVILAPIVRAAGVPYTLVEKSIEKIAEIRRAGRTDSFEKNSVVWAVFDVDEHPKLEEAIALAAKHGVKCAISNPCIEVWGLFHIGLYEKPSGRREAQAELARQMPGYHHDDSPIFPWDRCRGAVDNAIVNSIRAKERREAEGVQFPDCNPTTSFHELLVALRGD